MSGQDERSAADPSKKFRDLLSGTGKMSMQICGFFKSASKDKPRIQNDEIVFLFVHKGTGIIYVNREKFFLKPGVLLCLGPFHSYSISPSTGVTLKYSEVHVDSGVYLYILSCPYLKTDFFFVPSSPGYAQLSDKEATIAEEAMNNIIKRKSGNKEMKNRLNFTYVVKLYGLLLAQTESN